MKKQIKKILIYPLTAVLLVAFTITSCSDVAGPDSQRLNQASVDQFADASANQGIDGDALDTNITDGKQQGKIYVCKYVRTPNNKKGGGDFEVLKRGNKGLVHVSPNSVRNVAPSFPTVNIGDYWTDAHTLSIVIDPQVGFDVLSGNFTEVQLDDKHGDGDGTFSIEELCIGVLEDDGPTGDSGGGR